jgi:nitrous oxidase accessory protein NosD
VTVIYELLIVLVLASASTPKTVVVENSDELDMVLMRLQPGMTIEVAEGLYELDNPISLDKSRLTIVGVGADKVRVIPKNAGEPVFAIDADGTTLSGLEIDGRLADDGDFAAFGIFISPGVSDCRITNNVIRHIQATAIVGYDVSQCTVDGNVISDIAADGVRLTGSDIVVTNNFIHTIFDEPLDLAGEKVVVRDNRIASGRIGIALGSSGRSVVRDNVVAEQYEEGIVFGIHSDDEIAGNVVINAGIRSYKVLGSSDEVVAVSSDNIACVGGHLDPRLESQDPVPGGVNEGLIDCAHIEAKISPEVQIFVNRERPWTYSFVGANHELTLGNAADSDDRNIELVIAEHLKHINTGVLSVHVDGTTAQSDITSSLARTLINWSEMAVGPVRWPFLRARANKIDRWVLRESGQDRLWVTRRPDGSKVRITVLTDEKPTLAGRWVLLRDHAQAALGRIMD